MTPEHYPDCHLTYCSNVHPGASWSDHFRELEQALPPLKQRLSPDAPFGVGLRVSAAAAVELLSGDTLERFREWLDQQGLYVFTLNGFPYGHFHRQRVKDQVYAPDWRSEERQTYTLNLVKVLSALLPEGSEGGISTSPLSYKPWLKSRAEREETFRVSAVRLADVALEMHQVHEREGREIHLDIEPEPDCLLENSAETVDFFTDWLMPLGGDHLVTHHGVTPDAAREILQRHITVCYDTCHFAVEFEEADQALERFRQAGIRIGKVQISSALKIDLSQADPKRELSAFDEPVYLHQVVERQHNGTLHQYRDLPHAFEHVRERQEGEWRVHFHVPIFMENFGAFGSTRDHIAQVVTPLLKSGACRHFEIETYTWEVLPGTLKLDLVESIGREFDWALELFRPTHGKTAQRPN